MRGIEKWYRTGAEQGSKRSCRGSRCDGSSPPLPEPASAAVPRQLSHAPKEEEEKRQPCRWAPGRPIVGGPEPPAARMAQHTAPAGGPGAQQQQQRLRVTACEEGMHLLWWLRHRVPAPSAASASAASPASASTPAATTYCSRLTPLPTIHPHPQLGALHRPPHGITTSPLPAEAARPGSRPAFCSPGARAALSPPQPASPQACV